MSWTDDKIRDMNDAEKYRKMQFKELVNSI